MADKYYAVIDTNVIVSALISKKAESYPLSVMAHVSSGGTCDGYGFFRLTAAGH